MASYGIAMQLDVKVPMRDGVRLSADIYLPHGAPPVPAVLIRTPYSNNSDGLIEQGRRLAASGYACVIQDCRGRWDSDGDFYPFREAEDGFDTQEWVGLQPWCNGKLGTAGASYLGMVQWTAAPLRSSHLACMAPRVMSPDFHGGVAYPGGAWEWPLSRTEWRTAYLDSGGGANTLRGDGRLAFAAPADEVADQFTYDPRYPVQTVGGNNCCSPEIVPWGPYDQRGVEMRHDVLCYTSEPLAEDLEMTGPIELLLYAATDGLDTDWTAKLVDVSPTGYARNLCDGIIRARYRQGMSGTALLEPGAVYEYRIEVGVTGNLFRAGHRIRLQVSSSNFPRFDRNPNTGNEFGIDQELRAARQTVYHGPRHPSHLRLPVIPHPPPR